MFDEFAKMIQDTINTAVHRATEDLRKEIRALKHGERLSYSLKEAEAITGIPYDTLRARCKAGKLAYVQENAGGSILVKREDLDRYLDENRQEVEEHIKHKSPMKISSR
ncbi:MAG TPA: helix-turn-helix domain-containing protein [Chitinophagales bacterium]|nr:helix-turn-helix domain-containing protein [Chitinophagales bacterium]